MSKMSNNTNKDRVDLKYSELKEYNSCSKFHHELVNAVDLQQVELTLFVLCMFYVLRMILLLVMPRGCKYAPDFILQTCIPINENTHRLCVGARGSPLSSSPFSEEAGSTL